MIAGLLLPIILLGYYLFQIWYLLKQNSSNAGRTYDYLDLDELDS
jgi:hypothetical protein